jgi:hypothetical protein
MFGFWMAAPDPFESNAAAVSVDAGVRSSSVGDDFVDH